MNTPELEVWKDIPGYEGFYRISNHGRVLALAKMIPSGKGYSFKKQYPEKFLKPSFHQAGSGYYEVHLLKRARFYIHRLVAQAFIPNPNNYPYINHKDGNGLNNRVDNLEWCTAAMNTRHAIRELGKVWGKNTQKKTINVSTGITYESVLSAYNSSDKTVKYSHFSQMVGGYLKNTTNFKTIE